MKHLDDLDLKGKAQDMFDADMDELLDDDGIDNDNDFTDIDMRKRDYIHRKELQAKIDTDVRLKRMATLVTDEMYRYSKKITADVMMAIFNIYKKTRMFTSDEISGLIGLEFPFMEIKDLRFKTFDADEFKVIDFDMDMINIEASTLYLYFPVITVSELDRLSRKSRNKVTDICLNAVSNISRKWDVLSATNFDQLDYTTSAINLMSTDGEKGIDQYAFIFTIRVDEY